MGIEQTVSLAAVYGLGKDATLEFFLNVFLDSALDTLELLPFLFLTYLAMEVLEHSAEGRMQQLVASSGRLGPVVGSLLGALPQCGFSAMASTLFSGRVITVGTLVAVILSTSDELIPVCVAQGVVVGRLVSIILAKVAIGLVVGLALDVVLRGLHRSGDGHTHIHELCEREHCHCDEDDAQGGEHRHAHGRWAIVRSALVHTLQVTVFIFLITLACGLVIEGMGTDALATVLGNHPVRATFLAALVGLIPNCGASVAITELYLDGVLSTGPMLAGLLTSGGLGLLVLFRTNADMRQNLLVTAFVYAVGVIVGLFATSLGIIF